MADVSALLQWLDACPTPFHVVRRAAETLRSAGYVGVERIDGDMPSKGYIVRDGSIAAW